MQHRLSYTSHTDSYMADPIMSAGRESFYTALESIVDSVGYVLFDKDFSSSGGEGEQYEVLGGEAGT